MLQSFYEDLNAVRERDPAPHSKLEILLLHPGFHAVRAYRLAHWCYLHRLHLLAQWLSLHTRKKTGIEIHPAANIGSGLLIDHGMGVVIGETCAIGTHCTIYQGVTLGGTGKETGKRHPTLGNEVLVGAGAKVLGAIPIGSGAKIAAGAVVLHPVPEHATAVGVPAKIVRRAAAHSAAPE